MAIHEKSLIDPSNLLTAEKLVVEGVDVSGHWNTMILPRTWTDYDADFYKVIQQYPGGENVHRCWQCGSCTNSCTMYAINTDFNPRYWIYLTNLGYKSELIKDKDIIWQCVSCNKCTNICPKDVRPEGVMKALAHWLEDEGLTAKSRSTMSTPVFLKKLNITSVSSMRPRSMHWRVNSSSNTDELLFGVCPSISSQCASAFMTPSGRTSLGQMLVHLLHDTHCQMMSLSLTISDCRPRLVQ